MDLRWAARSGPSVWVVFRSVEVSLFLDPDEVLCEHLVHVVHNELPPAPERLLYLPAVTADAVVESALGTLLQATLVGELGCDVVNLREGGAEDEHRPALHGVPRAIAVRLAVGFRHVDAGPVDAPVGVRRWQPEVVLQDGLRGVLARAVEKDVLIHGPVERAMGSEVPSQMLCEHGELGALPPLRGEVLAPRQVGPHGVQVLHLLHRHGLEVDGLVLAGH
mmetsp:Transcript_76785/g.248561  ORF Transcript_76785/g.248561 Transcript_76785/m.248561 type:complete len:221 (-) Transcript_76785:119-781(-)